MIITKAYINTHKTKAGAWTQSQIQALGVKWPPTKGWQDRITGNEISEEDIAIFERALTAKQAKPKPSKLQLKIESLEAKIKELEEILKLNQAY